MWANILLMIGVSSGIVIGLHLPSGVVCRSSQSACYLLRFWGKKTAIDLNVKPKPKANNSKKQ
ncbi:hypothetical protein [Gloeothece verrucosa]|uniref:hypothetical protein n=1 Tax=Gloeothece verrucosa TaxID=2546359 RepID=UPI0012FF1334|nr:hypothetical protein [Gloeothece verrucosa]